MDALPFPRPAESLARPARRWLVALARWGFIANGIVYLTVGTLALRWALGDGGQLTDPEGAMKALQRHSFGKPLLLALVPGFFSYAIWRVLAAVFDGEHDGSSPAGLFNRAFGVLKGILYAGVGITALEQALRTPAARSSWVSTLLRGDGGRAIMFVVAGALLGFACSEVYRAFHAKLSQGLRLQSVSGEARRWIVGVSRFGIGGRGVVIGAFAVLLFRYAVAGRAALPGARQSFNVLGEIHPAMYLVAGGGIIAYGIYLLVLARYRRVETG